MEFMLWSDMQKIAGVYLMQWTRRQDNQSKTLYSVKRFSNSLIFYYRLPESNIVHSEFMAAVFS